MDFSAPPKMAAIQHATEAILQKLLMAGTPIAKATHGHIMVLASCCRNDIGAAEYLIVDSTKGPTFTIAEWMNYTLLILGPPLDIATFAITGVTISDATATRAACERLYECEMCPWFPWAPSLGLLGNIT
jgi:hypothetical protein